MCDRDRLIAIVKDSLIRNISKSCKLAENITDDLINEGVIVLPCKVGGKLYILYSVTKEIEECDITGFIIQTKHDVIQFKDGTIYTIWNKDYNAHFGKTLFLTREEAEEKLKE